MNNISSNHLQNVKYYLQKKSRTNYRNTNISFYLFLLSAITFKNLQNSCFFNISELHINVSEPVMYQATYYVFELHIYVSEPVFNIFELHIMYPR